MAKIKTARLILMNPSGEVLLGRRPFHSKSRAGQLDFFGGRRNQGESAFDAMLREVSEESGMDPTGLEISHVYKTKDTDGPHRFVRDYFHAQIPEFPTIRLSEHIGSVVLPAAVALSALSFEPHRLALTRALDMLS
jgi:8-oxo-dGTP pyrophosphatase MutT (NUDIX family)